jgi:hypothetical protein
MAFRENDFLLLVGKEGWESPVLVGVGNKQVYRGWDGKQIQSCGGLFISDNFTLSSMSLLNGEHLSLSNVSSDGFVIDFMVFSYLM